MAGTEREGRSGSRMFWGPIGRMWKSERGVIFLAQGNRVAHGLSLLPPAPAWTTLGALCSFAPLIVSQPIPAFCSGPSPNI